MGEETNNNQAEPAESPPAENPPGQRPEEDIAEREAVTLSFADYQELKTLAEERDEYLKKLRRAMADYLNMKNRLQQVQQNARQQALREVAKKVLPLAESLSRALKVAEETEGAEQITEGLRLTENEFYAILENLGIEPIEATGRPFDPAYHEALFQQPTDEVEPNRVIEEVKKGFTLGGELLRPAQVVVSAPQQEEGN